MLSGEWHHVHVTYIFTGDSLRCLIAATRALTIPRRPSSSVGTMTVEGRSAVLALQEEMERMVHRAGDRIIKVVTSGPHDRIKDPVSAAFGLCAGRH